MTSSRTPLVVDIGPLREAYYTGIPNVVAEICDRLIEEDWLDLYFDLDGKWIETSVLRRCLAARSGSALAGAGDRFRPAADFRKMLADQGKLDRTVALYTDHRPAQKLWAREGKIVYDLSMVLAPECHPEGSVQMYTSDLAEQIASSDVLFCISRSTARDVEWVFGVKPDRIKVALLGNNVELAKPDRMRDMIAGRPVEPYLLVLGSIEPRKNAALVLKWLAGRPEVLKEMRVVFAGRQAWGDDFRLLAERNGLETALSTGRIVFTGYVDDRLKAALLTGAAALVYPSIFEGFGLPLLEAMSIGTPVLSSVSTSMPEVVGDCGYYFDPFDVASLDRAYEALKADRLSGAVEAVVDKARERAQTFSYDKTYAVILGGLFPSGRPRPI
ncbi:glycosyltransferase family 1 protein [Fulvimarina endophytica]|uniref:Glycosyltransferase family 1 protein n=1 Tax=Fulvimarina endophytica TaxID=2293836 RepID=A0A371X359_9HYPH|nr:glycosyltransferase family 1 protein [Fulvimarina endophytica]RFC63639.1 glycosyltransferase family 1 protein [Fulvimarina endophytica]